MGLPYALPMLQYTMKVKRVLDGCPKEFTIKIGSKASDSVTLFDPALKFGIKLEATPGYVPGERYVVDYDALSSVLKTSSFVIETTPNGLLDSVNVAAEDKTADVIKETVGAALSIATAVGTGGTAQGVFKANRNAWGRFDLLTAESSFKLVAPVVNKESQAAQRLRDLIADEDRYVCTPEAEAALVARKAAKTMRDTAVEELAKTNRALSAATLVAGLRRATGSEVQALSKALAAQDAALVADTAASKALDDAAEPLQVLTTEVWPKTFDTRAEALAVPQVASAALGKLVFTARRKIKIVALDALSAWFGSLDEKLRSQILKDNPDLKKLVREDGSLLVDAPNWADTCQDAANTPDVSGKTCVDRKLAFSVSLSDGVRTNCAETGAVVSPCNIAMRDAGSQDSSGAWLPANGRQARDLKLDKGLFVRPPVAGVFRACRNTDSSLPCAASEFLAESPNASVPQLGQLRFLPFQNGIFEAAKMSLDLRDDGSIAKFSYERTKAAAADALAAMRGTVDQYNSFIEKRDKRRSDTLTAGRTAAVADLQFEIDMIEKRKALLKAQTPETPDARAAINDEIATLAAETNRLAAKLAKLKAEEALVLQSGGGDGGGS